MSCNIHTMEYYYKKKNLLIHATTWIKLKNIMLSVRNQMQIMSPTLLHLNEILEWIKLACGEKKNHTIVDLSWGISMMGHKRVFLGDESVLFIDIHS